MTPGLEQSNAPCRQPSFVWQLLEQVYWDVKSILILKIFVSMKIIEVIFNDTSRNPLINIVSIKVSTNRNCTHKLYV